MPNINKVSVNGAEPLTEEQAQEYLRIATWVQVRFRNTHFLVCYGWGSGAFVFVHFGTNLNEVRKWIISQAIPSDAILMWFGLELPMSYLDQLRAQKMTYRQEFEGHHDLEP